MRFYLVDHRTPLGKLVDVGLLVLNLAFIALVVLDTYSLSEQVRDWLWRLEVAIAAVFLAEYVLRLYSAPNRLVEFFNIYAIVDIASILPTLAVAFLPGITAVTTLGLSRLGVRFPAVA